MKYTTEFDETNGICTVQVTGLFQRPGDSMALRQFASAFAVKHSCIRFLIDMTQAEIMGEWIDAVPAITADGDPEHKQAHVKAAVVYSSNLSDNKLLESIASTKGYLWAVFDEMDEAVKWLKL